MCYKIKLWTGATSYIYMLYNPAGKPPMSRYTKFCKSMRLLFML